MRKYTLLLVLIVSVILVGCETESDDDSANFSYCIEYPSSDLCTEEILSQEERIQFLLTTYQKAESQEERNDFCDAFVNKDSQELLEMCKSGSDEFLPVDFNELRDQFDIIESDGDITKIEVLKQDGSGYVFDLDMSISEDGLIQINSIVYNETEDEYVEMANGDFEALIQSIFNDMLNDEWIWVDGVPENNIHYVPIDTIIDSYFSEGFYRDEVYDLIDNFRRNYTRLELNYARFIEYRNGYYIIEVEYTYGETVCSIEECIHQDTIVTDLYSAWLSGSDINIMPIYGAGRYIFSPSVEDGANLIQKTLNNFDSSAPDCYKSFQQISSYYYHPDQDPTEACEIQYSKWPSGEILSVELDVVTLPWTDGWVGYLATLEVVDSNSDTTTEYRYVTFGMTAHGLAIDAVNTYEYYQENLEPYQ